MTDRNTDQQNADQHATDLGFLAHLERIAMQPLLADAASIAVDVNDVRLAIETIGRLLKERS
jgi:hypothetical protein